MIKPLQLVLLFCFLSICAKAQENYEIQVYASPTMKEGTTMIELHSNYTLNGSKTMEGTVYPTNHAVHETIEITHGWTPWFETGFYFFNAVGNDGRSGYVGSHIRPRVAAPAAWNWPVGVSLSLEFGFQKAAYDESTASLEIRPIIDKTWGKWYVALNPTVEKSFAGPDPDRRLVFSPNVKASYGVSKAVALGIEYYGSTGPFFHYNSFQQQQHDFFVAADLNVDPRWEINGGFGYGITQATDKAIFKLIFGRRF